MTPVTTIGAILAGVGTVAARSGAGTLLDPVQPVLLPDAALAENPLAHLGGNGPWTAAPDVNGISSDVPENCYVDQAAYVLRHGSRYPDSGAHGGWVDMARRFRESNYSASGPLSFFHSWDTPLTRPDIQIAQLSQTGYKELHDLGYTLRTRYPDLYQEGEDFYVWANNYTRVIQTAQLFVRGYLGPNSTLLGKVVSVTSRGFPDQLGNTLAPSDMCPSFKDDSAAQQAAWRSIWLPPFIKRLSRYISGNLTLEDSQWNDFPYICGFESQIRGRLSPFCDTFTQEELEQYEYHQDLRYYYGVGPAANVSSKMMVPFLNALMQRFSEGPGAEGIAAGGGSFRVPRLLMNFLNDGQLNQLAVATGVFDEQKPLPLDRIARDRLWRSSRISPMRGTIAFERLNCRVSGGGGGGGNGNSSSTTTKPPTSTTSRACKPRPTTGATGNSHRARSLSGPLRNETFVRIRINEAVYPVPSCQDGPGRSCSLSKYVELVAKRLGGIGSFADLCNATDPATPSTVQGASFLTNLDQPHLRIVQA